MAPYGGDTYPSPQGSAVLGGKAAVGLNGRLSNVKGLLYESLSLLDKIEHRLTGGGPNPSNGDIQPSIQETADSQVSRLDDLASQLATRLDRLEKFL